MSAWLIIVIVITMLTAPTLLGATPVSVTKDIVEMEQLVMVSHIIILNEGNLTLNFN